MAKRKKKFKKRKFYRLNHYIQADQVRVVDEKGKQIGVMLLGEALKQAREKGLDLVEVAPKAQPPVCKIIDFKKFKYLESKRAKEERKKTKKVEIKEIRLTPFMADGDFGYRMKRASEFLKEGHRVKLVVSFKGRQMGKKEFGYQILKKSVEELDSESKTDGDPRFIGRRLMLALAPDKGGNSGKKEKDKNQKISRPQA